MTKVQTYYQKVYERFDSKTQNRVDNQASKEHPVQPENGQNHQVSRPDRNKSIKMPQLSKREIWSIWENVQMNCWNHISWILINFQILLQRDIEKSLQSLKYFLLYLFPRILLHIYNLSLLTAHQWMQENLFQKQPIESTKAYWQNFWILFMISLLISLTNKIWILSR